MEDKDLTEMLNLTLGKEQYRNIEDCLNKIVKTKPIVHYTLNFDSILVLNEDLENGNKRLLDTDNYVVLPMGVPIKFLITSADVLHS